jgi:hypothetical protein
MNKSPPSSGSKNMPSKKLAGKQGVYNQDRIYGPVPTGRKARCTPDYACKLKKNEYLFHSQEQNFDSSVIQPVANLSMTLSFSSH